MEFDSEKTMKYWIDSATYDLETGKTLLRSKRFPYALFFGHLAIEKILKALPAKQTGTHAPYCHSLFMLAGKSGLSFSEEMRYQLVEFMEYHTDAQHPDAKKEFYQ